MGQRPIGVKIQSDEANPGQGEMLVVSVGEAARRLGVSERTVFRLLKSGQLERVVSHDVSVDFSDYDSHMTDNTVRPTRIVSGNRSAEVSHDSNSMTVMSSDEQMQTLQQQVREKDEQIAQMLQAQQDMSQTIRHLQQQMFELAHLVLTHNVAAAQAKAEAELKAQELVLSRRGLANLFGARTKK